MSVSSSSSAKFQQLNKVFDKVADVTIGHVTEAHLIKYYGFDIINNTTLDVQGALIRSNIDTETRIKEAFVDVCNQFSIEDVLSFDNTSDKLNQPLLDIVDKLRANETEKLQHSSAHLTREIKRLQNNAEGLRQKIRNELEAITQEAKKIEEAVLIEE